MSIDKKVYKWTAIVPVRFTRAPHQNDATKDSGPPNANAPDPDDRGYVPEKHRCAYLPIGFEYSGPVASLPETRVRLIREDIADAAQLYVTSSNNTIVELTTPAPGNALPNTAKMMIKFRVKNVGDAFLEVRFGSDSGPIIHRLRLCINKFRSIWVKAHSLVISGTTINDDSGNPVPSQSSLNTKAAVQGRIDLLNAIYFPYGIKFTLKGNVDVSPITLSQRGAINCDTEWETLIKRTKNNKLWIQGGLNIFFVPQIVASDAGPDLIGGVASNARTDPNFMLMVADWAREGQTIAHEIGHILNLINDPKPQPKFIHTNCREDNRFPGTGKRVRDDIVSRRRLMWAFTECPSRTLRSPNFSPYKPDPGGHPNYWAYHDENIMTFRENVGYGVKKVGTMLTIKQLDKDRSDLEMKEVQKTADFIKPKPKKKKKKKKKFGIF